MPIGWTCRGTDIPSKEARSVRSAGHEGSGFQGVKREAGKEQSHLCSAETPEFYPVAKMATKSVCFPS